MGSIGAAGAGPTDAGGAVAGRIARYAGASVVGGAAIALGDHLFHVRTGVLVHHWHPQWDGQALVVWPIFMAAAAAMLATASIVVRLVPGPPTLAERLTELGPDLPAAFAEGTFSPQGVRRGPTPGHLPPATLAGIAVSLVAFYAAYALTGWIGSDHPWWCLGVLAATFAVRLWSAWEPWRVLVVGVLIGLGGCAGEAAIAAIGLFDYVRSDVAGVPLWLFPLYLHGAFAVVALVRWIDRADPAGSSPDPVDRHERRGASAPKPFRPRHGR